jgi:tetratricopeptide (TPR) repeat protein
MKSISLYIISMIFIATIYSCHPKLYSHSSLNMQSTDANGKPMLLGRCTKERLEQTPFNIWFTKNYNDYSVDSTTADEIKLKLQQKHFMIFMGTWCGDSRREVPRMFKLLDYCGVKSSQIELIMLNDFDSVYKQSPNHEERGMNIHRVPDLIAFDNKTEIGRIVESPVVSLEKDLLKITNGYEYTPNYKAVSFLIDVFKQKNVSDIENNYPDLLSKVKSLTSGASELNTYGYVLMSAGEMQKAGIIFKLNVQIYPDNANVFDSFGEYYLRTGNKLFAKENYQKVLQLDPGNKNATKMIEQLQ